MSIGALEKQLFTRDDEGFKESLFSILETIERGNPVLGGKRYISPTQTRDFPGIHPLNKDASFFDNQNYVHRLATCITGFLCAPSLSLSIPEIRKLLLYKTHLTDIFFLSDFGNMDHIAFYRGLWDPEAGFRLETDKDVVLLMAIWTMNSEMPVAFDVLGKKAPQDTLFMLAATLYQFEQVQTARGFQNFQAVYDQFLNLPDNLDIQHCLTMLANIWMGCSYWDIEDHHAIKRKINQMIRTKFANIPETDPGPLPQNPRIAILAEQYRSDHAMYRCYHARIVELKKHFRTCLFVGKAEVDDISRQAAHECVEVETRGLELSETARKIAQFKPDIILYPSLGMNIWSICLSNFRLAPVQIMGFGHPASAMTPTIDYGFLSGVFEGPDYQKFCAEKLFLAYGEKGHITLHPDLDENLRCESLTPDTPTVRIAINSSLMKVSDRVLAVCKMLMDNSSTPLEFHFFPVHNRGFKLQAYYRKLLQAIGDNVVVHEPQPYPQYMQALSRCHFAIGSFPFGGTNTNVDAILLEQPKAYLLQEKDLASFTDANDFNRYDKEAGFLCSSELELIAKAITWAHNPFELEQAKSRVGIMRETLKASIANSEAHPHANSYVEGIRAIQQSEE